MDKTDVHFFLEKLEQRINFVPGLTSSQKVQLRSLYQCVDSMRDYLKMTEEETRNENPEVNELMMKIGDLVFDAENIVDLFIVEDAGGGGTSDLATELSRIEEEMELLKSEAERVISRDKIVAVGLEEKVDLLIGELVNQDQKPTIKSIVGLPGVGKTTLAQKLFDDPRTKDIFEICAWVTVSQKYQKKRDLLIDLLKSSSSSVLDYVDTASDDQLGEYIFRLLKDKKYLIVIDDIWSIEAWYDIKRCFPNQHNGSAIIFTSRDSRIGIAAAGLDQWKATTHELLPLSEEDSWRLLQAKVFGNGPRSCPQELEEIGMRIAKHSNGVPLTILAIGNLLKNNEDRTPEWWSLIARSVAPTIATENMDTLTHSYNSLPLHLKACFLYLGLFPHNYEIPVRKLVWLLIAEGFVSQQSDDEGNNLEITAQCYLDELVDRNLVIVSRRRSNGAPKACRIHEYMHDLSIQKGKEEKFLTLSSFTHLLSSNNDMQNKYGRCYIGSQAILEDLLEPCALKLRSLVCLTTDKALNSTSFKEMQFKLLKVLDLISLKIPFPNDIGNLVLLKYLALWSEISCLPPSVTKLVNLETLILSTENTVTLPRDIWKMVKLRHLHNKKGAFHFDCTSTSLEKMESRANILENLQTLHPLCSCNSCSELLVTTRTVKKLGLSGNLITESGALAIPQNLDLLQQLETLSCINRSVHLRSSSAPIDLVFPNSLKSLTLKNTLLKWEEISVLGNLEHLEVLKILDDACVVSEESSEAETDWYTSDLEFPKLKYLKMRRLDITKWDDAYLHFYSLEELILEECRHLEVIPFDLAQGPSLHTIEVIRCDKLLEDFAMEIVKVHKQQCGDEDLKALITS